MRVAVLQTNTQADKQENLDQALGLLELAARQGVDLSVLPEAVDFLGDVPDEASLAEVIPGPTSNFFAAAAARLGIWILAGSIHERSADPAKSYNTSLLFNRSGELVAKYRKIHLYDVVIPGSVDAKESDWIVPGRELVTAEIEGHRAGLTICYDLRFPELFRKLTVEGAEMLFLPSAFTEFTGKDHWEVLIRARAIENQCFVLAAGQFGKSRYGRSMIVDPWGTILAIAPDKVGIAVADLDFDALRRVRSQLPSLANRRQDLF